MNTTTQITTGQTVYWNGKKCIVTNALIARGKYIQISPVGNGDCDARYYQVYPDEVTDEQPQIDFTRINNDTNGNPRFVCHFLVFLSPKDKFTSLEERYQLALSRSRQLGGKKFHNKQYGGGIVFQMYDGEQTEMSP